MRTAGAVTGESADQAAPGGVAGPVVPARHAPEAACTAIARATGGAAPARIEAPFGTAHRYPLSPWARRAVAFRDIAAGARAIGMWGRLPLMGLARIDGTSLLRSLQGFLFSVLAMCAVAFLLGRFMRTDPERYIPHLVVGAVVWLSLRSFAGGAVGVFSVRRWCIRHTTLPLSVHIFEYVFQASLRPACFAVAAVVALGAIFGRVPGWEGLLAVPGLALLYLNGLWLCLAVATVSLRYPKQVRKVVRRGMRVLFFVTPIIWMPHFFPNRREFVDANPMYHLLEIVRGPLLGSPPPAGSWLIAVAVTAAGWMLAFEVFSRSRSSIRLWI